MEIEERRDVDDAAVVAAVAAVEALILGLPRRSSPELISALEVVDRLGRMVEAARVAITVEAIARGDVDETGLADRCVGPSACALDPAGVGSLDRCAG